MAEAAQALGTPKTQTTNHGEVVIGELPNDFLRMPNPTNYDQVANDEKMAKEMAAMEVQQQNMMSQMMVVTNRFKITVLEAKLNKNYGVVRMDPYCRIRVNHRVYETDTSYNGAKNPQWTKSISVPLSEPVEHIYVEIFDEKSLTTDSRIAWTRIELSEQAKKGEQVDDWWPLSGKLGEEMEGTVHIVMSIAKVQQATPMPPMQPMPGMPLMLPGGYTVQTPGVMQSAQFYQPGMPMYQAQPGMPMQQQQQQQQPTPVPQGPLFTEADVKQIKEMFPDVEEDAIKTVLEASRGNKDAAINSLLSMQ
uniref:Toll-interacting protein n=1 Tax=Ciona savignyi TaxID=51511 RepID=H2YLR6_CIOSA